MFIDEDQFTDATDPDTTAEAIEDGEHVILNVYGDDGNGNPNGAMGIALTAVDARRLARLLNMLAAGI